MAETKFSRQEWRIIQAALAHYRMDNFPIRLPWTTQADRREWRAMWPEIWKKVANILESPL